jgi:acyl-CoA thioesterase
VTVAAGFDADTALEPDGELRWHGNVPPTWSIGTGPNGGFMAALAARAAELAAGTAPRSLTLHYLKPPAEAGITVTAEIVRQGRSATFLRLAMTQRERVVVTALAVCGAWYRDAPAWADGGMPDLPAPDDCLRVDPSRSGVAPLVGRYDMRMAVREPGERPVRVEGWIRTAEPRPVDDVALAAMTDAFLPPAFFRAETAVAVPTLELTIHFRGRPPEGEHPFVAATFTTRFAGGGVCEEDGELWSADGRLLAQSRQLALVRPR